MRFSFYYTIVILAAIAVIASCGTNNLCEPVTPADNHVDDPVVVIETSMGDITVMLYPLQAPITVGNFLRYVHEAFYDSLIFHRVIKNFIIQSGGYDENLQKKTAYEPIPNEADNGLSNIEGSIAMSRTVDPQSATCQFFINTANNPFLDFREETPSGWGYCVFGRVIEGMDVVHAIESVETISTGGFDNVPIEPVMILRLYRRD